MKKILLCYMITIASFLQAGLTEAEKHDLVQKSAPLLKFHPKDDSSLASAEWYIPRCSLEALRTDGSTITLVNLGKLTPENLANILKQYHYNEPGKNTAPGEIFLNPGAGKGQAHIEALKGPGYVNGLSDQHAYYNFSEISDTYAKISYWFFCPYQGNIDIVPGVNTILKTIGAGSHEGDWEHIDVRWEKIDNIWVIRDVFFARHGQAKGDLVPRNKVQFVNDQMKRDSKGTHPIAYVALGSHGTYPKDILFISKDADKTSDKGPMAFLLGKDKQGQWKLEDYDKQPWSPYIFRWGADLTKKFGGSPESPHAYGSFGRGKTSPAEFVVNGKDVWKVHVSKGKDTYFKVDPRARIKEMIFKIANTNQPIQYEIWKEGTFNNRFVSIGNKKLYGPFNSTDAAKQVPANFKDKLFIRALTKNAPDFDLEGELVE